MRAIRKIWIRALILFSCCSAMALADEAAVSDAGGIEGSAIRVRVVDAAEQPVADAIIWYGKGYSPVAPGTELAVISQIDKQFVPQVTVIRTGASVAFPNKDSVAHHVYSFAQPNAFEFALYKSDERPTFRFDHAGVVALGCNIHDSMLGYIVVVDSPHYAKTNKEGYAIFASAPAAGEVMHVWSARLDPGQPLDAKYDGDSAAGIVSVKRRQRAESRPAGGSLAWEDY